MVEDPGAVHAIVSARLPSTLVHCLYLFFEIPEEDHDGIDQSVKSGETERLVMRLS